MNVTDNKTKHIFLIGFMGTGKSSVAKELNAITELRSVDTDVYIEEATGLSIKDIFASRGEKYFRCLETKALEELTKQSACVISCGGGAVLRKENREIMKRAGVVVLLTASLETIEARVKNNGDRPLLKDQKSKQIAAMLNDRAPFYEAAADITISTEDKQIGEICRELMKKITCG